MLFLSVRGFFDYAGPTTRSRLSRSSRVAFRHQERVGVRVLRFSKLNRPAHRYHCLRFKRYLTMSPARLEGLHDPSTPDAGKGSESEKRRATLYRGAFPGFRLTIDDLLAERETVTARWSCHGTHKGDLGGIAPTGKQLAITGVSVVRFANGKMVEG